ncbi:hypothetical protein CIY_34710 [Butyrivibrio fibrisolvens 16/4]|nr:hypothetical protein CIY_34710 [Butyrivibrio fibrisolvens 16/4]
MHPEGDSEVSVPVFRVRNCDDIVLVKAAPSSNNGGNGGSSTPAQNIAKVINNINKAIDNAVDKILAPIENTPVGRVVRNVVNRFRAARDAALGVNEEAAEETTEEEVAVEEEQTETASEEATIDPEPQEQTIEDTETPTAGDEKNPFPVVPVAAGFVIILAGAAAILAKTGKLAILLKIFGK